jgi:hypothetical protein
VSFAIQLYDPPVLCVFNLQIPPGAYLRSCVRVPVAAIRAARARPATSDSRDVLDLFVEEIRFAHEEICLASSYQILAPFCVHRNTRSPCLRTQCVKRKEGLHKHARLLLILETTCRKYTWSDLIEASRGTFALGRVFRAQIIQKFRWCVATRHQ